MNFNIVGAEPLSKSLDKIHRGIITDYENVNHINIEQFLTLQKDELIVFDIREKREYEVSHLEGAIQVDPDLDPEDFLLKYGEAIKEKTAIYYCSVGRRSSEFAAGVNQASFNNKTIYKKTTYDNTTQSYNLVGGIFHWHNAEMPLVDDEKNTTAVHPYNFYWGRLIDNKSAISYQPK